MDDAIDGSLERTGRALDAEVLRGTARAKRQRDAGREGVPE